MNKEIQEYLKNNNATVRFTRNGKIKVTYDYGQLSKVESYDSFEQMFNWIKFDAHKQTQKLELEISGRQTGKTSRLIDAMVKHTEAGGICFLYCLGNKMGEHILSNIVQKIGCVGSGYFYANPSESTISKLSLDDLKRVRYFFDEFDFLKKEHQIYQPTGYYCTTPSKLRDISKLSVLCGCINRIFGGDEFIIEDNNLDLFEKLFILTNFNFERRMNYDLAKRFGNDYYYSKEKLRIESGEISA